MLRDLLLLLPVLIGACAGAPPPMSQAAPPVPTHAPAQAKLVFLWPPDSCEAGGYYAIATAEGRFIGNVARGTRLEVDLDPGSHTFMAWNPARERLGHHPTAADTPVVEVHALHGRTYFVRFAFGEWDERGPRVAFARGAKHGSYRTCASSAALVAVAPRSRDWVGLRDWLDALTPIRADEQAGQAWLDDEPGAVQDHRQLAAWRWSRMTHEARGLALVHAGDGVYVQPDLHE